MDNFKSMKYIILVSGVVIITCLLISFFIIPATGSPITNNVEFTDELITSNSFLEDVFIIKSENNKIVVYQKGNNTPYKTTDAVVSVLPQEDQKALSNGIEVKGKKNLKRALEDYCS